MLLPHSNDDATPHERGFREKLQARSESSATRWRRCKNLHSAPGVSACAWQGKKDHNLGVKLAQG